MYFHKIKSNKLFLKPFTIKRNLIVRISNFSGYIKVGNEVICTLKDKVLIIPEGSVVECNLDRVCDSSILEFVSINKNDCEEIKEKLYLLNCTMLSRKSNSMYLISDHAEIIKSFSLNRVLGNSDQIIKCRKELISQNIFNIILQFHFLSLDIGILFRHNHHMSVSERLSKIIMNAPRDHWTLDNAARALCVSTSTLRRNLSKENSSFSRVLIDIRLGLAINYLTFTNLSINKISELSGFNSATYFCIAFKKEYKMSPKRFRIESVEMNV